MHIRFNGKYEDWNGAAVSLQDFLVARGLNPEQLVIEYNGDILTRDAWGETVLADGDAIVALSIVGGG